MANQNNNYLGILNSAWLAHLAPRSIHAPTVISTFAGAGGSTLGYSMAGYRELLAIEWDDNAVATFKLNFPDVPVYHGDIAEISIAQCFELANIKAGELDVLDGSPPCQGFSTVGKRIMNDQRNNLFREYVRLLRGLQPKVFVMENVSGMVKGKMKLIFAEIMRELKASGYQVKACLMNAMYFHTPQSRERVIFIGVRNDLGKQPSHPKAQGRPFVVKDAIAQMAVPVAMAPEMVLQDNRLTRLYDRIKPGQSAEVVSIKGRNFSNMRKPHPGKPMFTIPKSVSNRGAFSVTHWSEKRLLSIPELKRLSSFPDNFQMTGGFIDQWARIGNSVPPLFMRAIAEHIRNCFL